MGLFNKKVDDSDTFVAVGIAGGGSANDKTSVVQVIRSRFYGKKGKEREEPAVSFIGGVSAAQVLSPSVASSPKSNAGHRREPGSSIFRSGAGNSNERSLPQTPPPPPSKNRSNERIPPSPLSRSQHDTPLPLASSSASRAKSESVHSPTPSTPRKPPPPTDTVTVTLAQRLNELAVANSEGLLNDDEYRLLRQNLFERFASNVTVPSEAPLVPITPARPRPRKPGSISERPSSVRPLSNFQVETGRPVSISSRTSGNSAIADLFRRATGRRSTSRDMSDTASVWSSTSNSNRSFFKLPRTLSKKSSNSSMKTDTSRQPDDMSISSRRPGSERGDISPISLPTRSYTGSIRKLAAPPSAFPNRAIPQETTRNANIYNVFDEDHLTTAKEIQQEILNMEAEARRLMDAFNGLEVTALAKLQRHHVRPSLANGSLRSSNLEFNWGVDSSDSRSQRRIIIADDAISTRSGTSSVAHSLARSAYSAKKTTRSKGQLNSPIGVSVTTNSNSRPGSLRRKNSTSSVTSDSRRSGKAGTAPPVPAIPHSISHGHLKAAGGSNISLVRSTGHLPMNTVPEDDRASTVRVEGEEEMENEMEDIRRRREEVQQRYEARLEYLRAKLKGAQLHEKLLRK